MVPLGSPGEREDVEIRHVREDVEEAHRSRPDGERSRKVWLGFCTSAGERHVIPRITRKRASPPSPLRSRDDGERPVARPPQVREIGRGDLRLPEDCQAKDHEHRERADLGDAEDGLDRGPEGHPPDVDGGQQENGKDRDDALRRQPELDSL